MCRKKYACPRSHTGGLLTLKGKAAAMGVQRLLLCSIHEKLRIWAKI